MFPPKGKNLGYQAGDNPLLSDLLLHDIEKNDIEPRITNNPTRRRLFKLHLGGTTHSPQPTLIPKHDPTTMNTRPPTSGSLGTVEGLFQILSLIRLIQSIQVGRLLTTFSQPPHST